MTPDMFDPKRTALLTIDLQNDFLHPDGAYGRAGGQGAGRKAPGRNVATLDQAYAQLGLKPSASDSEVKRAYRKLVSQYHPDKLVSRGLPEEMMGKTGLAISPQNPDTIYATIELDNRTGGFWRSDDGGENWEKKNDYLSGATGPHYYQEIFASPHFEGHVYQMDALMRMTKDGGDTFIPLPHETKHGDHHALAFREDDPN